MDALRFFKNIEEQNQLAAVTNKWTVKDVLAHLVGWERETSKALEEFEKNKTNPWFIVADDYQDFNEKIYREFKDVSYKELLNELEKWQKTSETIIARIGGDKLKKSPQAEWIFDEGEESHFEHHMEQVQGILKKQD